LPLSSALPVDEVVAFYGERGLPPVVQVSDPAVDAALAARAWRAEVEVDVLTGPVPAERSQAVVHASPDEAWLATWWTVDGRGGPAELDVATRMLRRIAAPTAYAHVVRDGRVVAVGRAVVQEGLLGVFSMGVLPEARRQGRGRQVLHALGSWGADHGARTAYLQVFRGNAPAQALYAAAGFARAYGYHYRTLP
jgi:N-acetylglutamate synthase